MENILISTIEWKKSKTGNDFARINKKFTCWAKRSDIETLDLLHDGASIEVDVYEKIAGQDTWLNIVGIKGIDGNTYRWDRDGNVFAEGEEPVQAKQQPVQYSLPKPDISPKLEQELQAGGSAIIDQINDVVKTIKEKYVTLKEDELTQIELKLSALALDAAKLYAVNNSKASQMEIEYKKARQEKIKTLQEIDPELTDTKAKANAEASMWEIQVNVAMQQDKAKSNDIIIGGVNNLLYALKDRIKFFRG